MLWKFVDKVGAYKGPLIHAAYPHTSRWDAVLTLVAGVLFRDRPILLVQASEFVGIQGRLLRLAGGFPVEIRGGGGVGTVDNVLKWMARTPHKSLALSPEGWTAATPRWRTGYYVWSMATGFPVTYCWVDYSRRILTREHPVELSGDPARDLALASQLLKPGVALYPDCASPIRFKAGWTLDWERLERQRELWRRSRSVSKPQADTRSDVAKS